MADNISLPAAGASIATDLVGSNHFQRVKLDVGTEGVSTQVNTSNPLPVQIQGQHSSSLPTYGAGVLGLLQVDANGLLLVNGRALTAGDIVTAQNTSFGQLFANVALSGGDNNPIATFSPTGGVFMLKAATADTRLLFYQTSTVISASGNSGDFPTAHIRELAIDINATATAGAGSLVFTLNRKGNDGIYYPVVTTSALNSVAKLSFDVGPGLLTNNHSLGSTCRLDWALTGTSVTCSANVWGKT